jgi:hypothetical protein
VLIGAKEGCGKDFLMTQFAMEKGITTNWKKGLQRIAILVGSILCVISIGYLIWRLVGPTISKLYEPPFEKLLSSIFFLFGSLLFLFCIYTFVYIFSGPWWENVSDDWISLTAIIVSLVAGVVAAMIYKDTYSIRILIQDDNAPMIAVFSSLALMHIYVLVRCGLIPCVCWITEGFREESNEEKDDKDE